MNKIFETLTNHILDENSVFVFSTEIACTSWQDKLLNDEIVEAIPLEKFIAWDTFKGEAVRSKIQNKTSIPSALRKLFSSWIIEKNNIACKNENPIFTSIINPKYSQTAQSFADWIASLLPQLQNWKDKISKKIPSENQLDEESKDLLKLYQLYSELLEKYNLFEPAWEKPPFDNNNKHYFIFHPELLEDYSEYEEILQDAEKENLVTLIHAENQFDEIPKVNYFSNTRTELRKVALLINKLHNEDNVDYKKIAIHIPQISEIRSYVKREFELYNIPFRMRAGKKLSEYPEGRLFDLIRNCALENFNFESLSSLFADSHFPWKVQTEINQLIEFAIKNHCVCSYDNKDILEQSFAENPQETRAREFYKTAKKIILKINNAKSFLEIRNFYFEFRDTFFDTEKFTENANLILGRCISELANLIDIENSFNDIQCINPLDFFTEWLSSKEYLAQTTGNGVSIFPYKVACQCSFDYHIVLQASQKNLSIKYSQLDFLQKDKREFLNLKDFNVSDYFINCYNQSSEKQTYFFASQKTFSGYALSYSSLEEIDRLSETSDIEDLYNNEKLFLSKNQNEKINFPTKLHTTQKDGFSKWSLSREKKSTEYEDELAEKISSILKKKFCDKNGRLRVSATSLNAFYKNPANWFFEKILKIEKESMEVKIIDDVFLGIIYHEIIKRLFTMIKNSTQYFEFPENKISQKYIDFIFENTKDVVQNFPESTNSKQPISTLTKQILLSQEKVIYQNLINFLEEFLNYFNGYMIKSIEEKFTMNGETSEYYLEGDIDCVLLSPEDKITIVDFKTYNFPDKKTDLQIPLYVKLYENYLSDQGIKSQVEQACFFSIIQAKPSVTLGILINNATNKKSPYKKIDRYLRTEKDCIDGENSYEEILTNLDEKIKFFVESVLTGKNFLISDEVTNKILFCSFENLLEEKIEFEFLGK